jgi:hypothetical protein
MATGRALEELTGYALFHNHMTIELVLPFVWAFNEPSDGAFIDDLKDLFTSRVRAWSS